MEVLTCDEDVYTLQSQIHRRLRAGEIHLGNNRGSPT